MSTQIQPLAVAEANTIAVTKRAILTADALREITEQRKLLAQFVSHHMVEGTDFGTIPGTAKPTLYKPGAEKLVDLFRCTPEYTLIKEQEDFDKYNGQGFFNYIFRVRLTQRDAAAIVAEGFGSANSREGRYRWRLAHRKCPSCGREAIIRGKQEYGGGWLCFAKRGGCGAKYADGDKSIEGQPTGQVENDDVATLANTILKMAKKRALVDGAIALARCSDLFTQDIEDLEHDEPAAPPTAAVASTSKPADITGCEEILIRAKEYATAANVPEKIFLRLAAAVTDEESAKQLLETMRARAARAAAKG